MRISIIPAISVLALAIGGPAYTDTTPLVTFTKHNISLRVEPADHSATVEVTGTMVCSKGWNLFFIRDSALVSAFSVGGESKDFVSVSDGDTAKLPMDLRRNVAGIELRPSAGLVAFESDVADSFSFQIAFTARFDDPVDAVQFSREKVGNEVRGTILERGAYLSAASCYYPQGVESLARFALAADIPTAWEAIADGNRVSTEIRGDRKVQQFENPFSSNGYVFMAAPYVVKTVAVDSIVIATCFFDEDTSLCDKYLSASADYIRMYQDLIGPYPFKQFTVAENFFPTGYGMPGWTLLGETVLRLPFIISSSLGHEVLHNWWGNSVYVDYARGNWCEAAAVYGADYRYKLLSSTDAARDYRKDILKEYLSYVNTGNDFPIREFTSRSSAETRTIGYSKAMMVFHLIERQIGSGPFFGAWKQVYRDYRGRAISWEEWISAFQQSSGQDLGYIIPQWIDRSGAPQLGLDVIAVQPAKTGDRKIVTLKVTQSTDTPYRLTVPIRAEGADVVEDTTVQVELSESIADITVPAAVTTIALDPDYHVFRRLYPEEVEPIISRVLGSDPKCFALSTRGEPDQVAFAAFAHAIVEDSVAVIPVSQLDTEPDASTPIILNPTPLPDYLAGLIKLGTDSVTIAGQNFSRTGHTFVMAGRNWSRFEKYLVVVTSDFSSLPRLGQLVPHYGKYSYLVFAGEKNVAKGQWPVMVSPLRKALP